MPSHFADRIGRLHASTINRQTKKQAGQFLTPIGVAKIMSNLAVIKDDCLRILDPGCGAGILSCCLVESLVERFPLLKEVEIVAYETDRTILSYCKTSYEYLKSWAGGIDIAIVYKVIEEDFILSNYKYLSQEIAEDAAFDIIISNPPYFKLKSDDVRAELAKQYEVGHSNIYSIFMAISAKLLKPDGELHFITPRSFASGSYFHSFRKFFFQHIKLLHVHLFTSRSDAFERDDVLQETVIIRASRKKAKTAQDHIVKITFSEGARGGTSSNLYVREQVLVDTNSDKQYFFIPTSEDDLALLKTFGSWKYNLAKFNIKISTGPIVAHRSTQFLQGVPSEFTVPLFWLNNIQRMEVRWPINNIGKAQYFLTKKESEGRLLENNDYIFIRRFSSKDDQHRLIAAPYFRGEVNADFFGVENKVNYVYKTKGAFERVELLGLCAIFNSSLFDRYFRLFNGNVNVSASEIMELPLPDLEIIKLIGHKVSSFENQSAAPVDEIVQDLMKSPPSL